MPLTPMSATTYFEVDSDGQTMVLNLVNPDEDVRTRTPLAWQAPDTDNETFLWMAQSAAAFHTSIAPLVIQDAARLQPDRPLVVKKL